MTTSPLRIAIAQPIMYWSGDENTASVLAHIAQAAAAGARLCVFPELALTGFHRQIRVQAQAQLVAGWMKLVQQACATHSIAVAIGAPTFGDDGLIYNSQLLVDEFGQCVAVVEKKGLTDPEATFFARGSARPVTVLEGRRCTAVICREIEDIDEVCAQLAPEEPEIIFWPGLMGPEEGSEDIDPPSHVRQAQQLARRLGVFVVQSNWPMSLNYPELSNKSGKSVVIKPTGEIAFSLPEAQAGLAVFTLGEFLYAWSAQSDPAHEPVVEASSEYAAGTPNCAASS